VLSGAVAALKMCVVEVCHLAFEMNGFESSTVNRVRVLGFGFRVEMNGSESSTVNRVRVLGFRV